MAYVVKASDIAVALRDPDGLIAIAGGDGSVRKEIALHAAPAGQSIAGRPFASAPASAMFAEGDYLDEQVPVSAPLCSARYPPFPWVSLWRRGFGPLHC